LTPWSAFVTGEVDAPSTCCKHQGRADAEAFACTPLGTGVLAAALACRSCAITAQGPAAGRAGDIPGALASIAAS